MKAYDSVRREVLYNILIKFGIPMKLVTFINMCLNETYSRVQVGKHVSDGCFIKNGLKEGDALLPLLFNFALEYSIRRVQVNKDDKHQLPVYADDVNKLGGRLQTIKKNTEALVAASKQTGLEMLIKLSTWSCLENRMHDKVAI